MMPADRPGDFVQAMMDLGATICRPKKPRCGECPLAGDCTAYASGTPEQFPEPKQRLVRPHRHGVAYWIERGGQVWLVRRPAKGLLGGMAALPGTEWNENPSARPNALGTVRHVFTHFSLDLHVVARADPEGEGWWQPLDRLEDAGLPTLYRKAIEIALVHHDRLAA
jgi:A/G-specific adenine glycosylase